MIKKELRKAARDSYEYFIENAKKMVSKGEGLEPIMHAAVVKDDQFSLLPISLKNADNATERRLMARLVASLIAKDGYKVIMFFFVFEAWGSKVKKDENAFSVIPSKDPNRFEIFAATAVEDTGAQSYLFMKIIREDSTCRFEPQERTNGAFSTTEFFTPEELERQKIIIPVEDTVLGSAWVGYKEGLRLQEGDKEGLSKVNLTSKKGGV